MAVSRTACIDCCFLFRQLAKQFVRPRADADVGSVVVGFIFQMIPRVSRVLSTILLRIGIFFCKRHNFQISQRGLFFTLLALPRPLGAIFHYPCSVRNRSFNNYGFGSSQRARGCTAPRV